MGFDSFRDGGDDERVCDEGKMGAVLLEGAGGQDDNSFPVELADLLPGGVGNLHLRLIPRNCFT
jgi:hypothetical protein